MGKYMKKGRGGRGVMEVITQGSSGVRTRARSQAMKKELVEGSRNNTERTSDDASLRNLAPAQISYLELRSRKLEKAVGFISDELPATQKTAAGESTRLSDLTNSQNPAHNSAPRLPLSLDDIQRIQRTAGHKTYDENQQFPHVNYCGDSNEAIDESSLQGFIQRSLQQWTKRGRAPPGVAHSRSNSRSNSVTREFPSLTWERLPHGILTRNQRKMGKQSSDTNECSIKAANVGMETEAAALCGAKSANLNKDFDVEVSLGENPADGVWSAVERGIQEETESSNTKEKNVALPLAEDGKKSRQSTCSGQSSPSIMKAPTDMEIEDFFLQVEEQLHRQFRDRYNFDPQNGIPLPGRYDWVKL